MCDPYYLGELHNVRKTSRRACAVEIALKRHFIVNQFVVRTKVAGISRFRLCAENCYGENRHHRNAEKPGKPSSFRAGF